MDLHRYVAEDLLHSNDIHIIALESVLGFGMFRYYINHGIEVYSRNIQPEVEVRGSLQF